MLFYLKKWISIYLWPFLSFLLISAPLLAMLAYQTTTIGYSFFRPFRKRQMKNLAKKLNLKFIGKQKRSLKNFLFDNYCKKNIIQGEYNNKQIEIFDYDLIVQHQLNIIMRFIIPRSSSTLKNPTHKTHINGKIYQDRFLPYLSTKKIEEIIKKPNEHNFQN